MNDKMAPIVDGSPVDLYREVHKGLRRALFEFTETAGTLGGSDRAGIDGFARLFAELDMMLETHHRHEDGEHLASLIERHVPEAATTVAEGHDEISRQLDELRSLVAGLSDGSADSAAVYDAVVAFTTLYLGHMQVEEQVVMPALQKAVPGDDLMAISMAIRTSVPPDDMCVFLRHMLPAMNPDERTATLGGMKAGAPSEIFELFWSVAEANLEQADLATVAERIAA
jgi:iron-sulfur cluster repair protein YtfE (RIC family)